MRTLSNPLNLLALTALPAASNSKAILGIDLGSLYMKVALVQRNSPLEIVTNMHSKRKTEQMVLFDAGSRFYGADASSLMARKPHLTPSAMSVMLGRDADHPAVLALAERHAFVPAYNATRSGVCLSVAGQEFTPEELVAMVLTHARDITAAYGVTVPLKDCVLTVPAFYTQHERRALLDAATLADLRVLALVHENTAAALHFGIDRIDEAPQTYLFYNMGAGSLQVSVVRYLSYPHKATKYAKEKRVGGFEVLASSWDATLGGASFDARLVEHMAQDFNGVWNAARGTDDKDVRAFPRAMTKLRIQANKIKHVLSANNDFPVFIDALQDDVNYQTHISRATFEELCHDLLLRAAAPIDRALKLANVTLDQLDAVEMIGGAMRVPKVREAMQAAVGDKLTLGMHLNSDESMALGAAFHGANVSTSFKVRHVGMADVNSFPVAVDLTNLATAETTGGGGGGLFGIGKKKVAEEAPKGDDKDAWAKRATVFKLGSRLGVKKTIAFTHDQDVHVALSYEDGPTVPEGTGAAIEQYDVAGIPAFAAEMAEKDLGTPKVSLQFEMDTSGLVRLVKAEAVVEEIVMVEEEVEVEDDEEEEEGKEGEEAGEESKAEEAAEGEKKEEGEEAAAAEEKEDEAKDDSTEDTEAKDDKKEDGDDQKEGDDKKEEGDDKKEEGDDKKEEEKKEEKKEVKKKKTKMVQKEQKKRHVRALEVSSYQTGSIRPYSSALLAESNAKLALLAKIDEERIQLEEAKNKFESYIYAIRNRLIDDEDVIAEISTEEQRAALSKSAEDAEEWMFDDGYTADLATYEEKYAELSAPAIKVFFRAAELTARPKALEALGTKLTKIEGLMTKWETTMTHITEEEIGEVLAKVQEVRTWLEEKTALQEDMDATEDPPFTSEEVPGQTKRIESLVARLLKKKKPKPPEKNETEAEEKNATEATPEGEATTDEGEAAEESSASTESPEGGETKEEGAGGEEETKPETPDGEDKIEADDKDDEL